MARISMNEWTVTGEVFYLKELEGEFAASVKIRGIASREGICSTQALELPCLLERRVYEEAKKKGFAKYKEVTLSGHLETWPLKNDRHGNMKIMLVCDYVMDIM